MKEKSEFTKLGKPLKHWEQTSHKSWELRLITHRHESDPSRDKHLAIGKVTQVKGKLLAETLPALCALEHESHSDAVDWLHGVLGFRKLANPFKV